MKLFHLLDLESSTVYEVKAHNWIEAIFKVTNKFSCLDLQVIAEQ